MKETRFIQQNKEKWREAENLLKSAQRDPEKLSTLFTQVVDDLSYSITYYPNRSVRVYLNKIARLFFAIIYNRKKEKRNQFMSFWLDEMPQIIYFCRREILISVFVFIASMAIGVLSSANDPQFVNTILGDSYVQMTEENIAKGDPMAVYKQAHEVDMFLGITFNNLMVAFRTYVMGIFIGIGTLGILLYNGIMVGSFQYYFVERGLFIESASTIWLHGTLEISSIILAGGAGLTLARGLIFPGTYSRIQSLQISGIRSLKFMLGIAPIFVLAGLIESFLTRYTEAPVFVKLTLILLSAAYIVGYFAIYPWMKSKKGFDSPLKEARLNPSIVEPTNFTRIKNIPEVLKDTFRFYSIYASKVLPFAVLSAAILGAMRLWLEEEVAGEIFLEGEWWRAILGQLFAGFELPSPLFILINGICTGLVVYRVMKLIDSEEKKTPYKIDVPALLQIILLVSIMYGAVYLDIMGILFAVAAFGLLTLTAFVIMTEKTNLFNAVGRSWDMFTKQDSQNLSLQFLVLLLSLSGLVLLSTPLQYTHMSILRWNFIGDDAWTAGLLRFIDLFSRCLIFYMILPVLAASFSYTYYSQREVLTATGLKEAIAKMGSRVSKNSKR